MVDRWAGRFFWAVLVLGVGYIVAHVIATALRVSVLDVLAGALGLFIAAVWIAALFLANARSRIP